MSDPVKYFMKNRKKCAKGRIFGVELNGLKLPVNAESGPVPLRKVETSAGITKDSRKFLQAFKKPTANKRF